MSQSTLNISDVYAALHQMGGKTVAQGMGRTPGVATRTLYGTQILNILYCDEKTNSLKTAYMGSNFTKLKGCATVTSVGYSFLPPYKINFSRNQSDYIK